MPRIMRRLALLLSLTLLCAGGMLAQPVDIYQRPLQEERSRSFDVLHYKVYLSFDVPTKALYGEAVITLTPLNAALEEVTLDAETFTVILVEDGRFRPLRFEQGPHSLHIHFDSPIAVEDTTYLMIRYFAEDIDIDGAAYGLSPTYDVGIGFKDATEDNPQLINTLSWPQGARHWIPSFDHPSDRATNETIVTVDTAWTVLSNGRLLGVWPEEDGRHTYHWSQELPHPTYLYVMVAGPYVVLEDSLGSLPVNYWVYGKDVGDAMRSFHQTPAILAFLEEYYGVPYPWVKYDQITIPGIGGGAESTTATVLGQSTIHDAAAEQDYPSDWLVAHEAAHQWWGNLISYRDWPETWLSESFATYSEYLWARHVHGPDEGAVNLLRKKESYFNEAKTRYQRPVVFHRWEYPNHNFDRHTYQKGAVILGMLSRVMGEEALRESMRHFLSKHAFQGVVTQDFMEAIRDATGQDLDWFFDQWIYSPGHPVLEIASTWDEAAQSLALQVDQVQDTVRGTPWAYRMPVTLRVQAETDTLLREEVWITQRSEVFTWSLPRAPDLVRFDEDDYLLAEWSQYKTPAELMYQLKYDNALGRAWAATALTGSADQPSVASALEDCAIQDDFWHVRAACFDALGVRADVELLRERSRLDAHSKVRVAALRALGDHKDPADVDHFKKHFWTDNSYVARAEALRSLGKSGDSTQRSFLEFAATIRSPRNVIQTAATRALEELE